VWRRAGFAQLRIALHGGFVRGQQQIEDLQPVGGNEVLLPAEHDFQSHARLFVLAHLTVDEDECYTVQQLARVVGFEDKIVRPALQPADDVMGIGESGDQNHRNITQACIRFDLSAQFVAVHFRHEHIADDERRPVKPCSLQGEFSVRRCGDPVTLLFEDVLQPLRLSCAVLGNDDVLRSTRQRLDGAHD